MFNPWALLFYIVCLLFYFGFLFFIEFLSWSLKSFQYLLVLDLKSQISELSSALFLFIFWFVSFSWTGSSCLFVVVSRAFFLFGINGCERSWVFFLCLRTGNSESQHFYLISVTLRNLFSWILYTIFSEPIYRLSIFFFIHFACCSSSSYSCASCTKMYLLKD